MKKAFPFPGADVIARKTRRLIARRLRGTPKRRGSLARHEWQRLVHDEIGTYEITPRGFLDVYLACGPDVEWMIVRPH